MNTSTLLVQRMLCVIIYYTNKDLTAFTLYEMLVLLCVQFFLTKYLNLTHHMGGLNLEI